MSNFNENTIYILDFDGVICDSIDECMLNSYNTYNNTNLYEIKGLPKKYKNYFYKFRHHVRPAKEYFIICKAYDMNVSLTSKKFLDYKNYYRKEINDFEDNFFWRRIELRKNILLWLSYHKIYDHASKFITCIPNDIYILTNKDYDSVKILSDHFGILNKIDDIFSKEISNDKSILFEYFFKNYNNLFNGKRIVFVDDNEFHLEAVCKYPIELYFANWGYSKSQTSNKFNEINSFMELV